MTSRDVAIGLLAILGTALALFAFLGILIMLKGGRKEEPKTDMPVRGWRKDNPLWLDESIDLGKIGLSDAEREELRRQWSRERRN